MGQELSIALRQGIFMAVIFEPREKGLFLIRPSVNYFENSLKSLVVMLWTAPGVKLPSYRKNGFNPSLWRCVLSVRLNGNSEKLEFLLRQVRNFETFQILTIC